MKNLIQQLLDKATSGRFIMVVIFSLTMCKAFLDGSISSDAFLPVMILIAEWYFKRSDRVGENQENGGQK
jgi:hypothetical protein